MSSSNHLAILLSFFLLLFLTPCFSAFPLCTNSWAPFNLKVPLNFCGTSGSSCCNSTDDAILQERFASMNISSTACGSVVQSLLCAKCNPFSADLFNVEPIMRPVPVLCNSTADSSPQSKDSAVDFCTQVWDSCKDTLIMNSPFVGPLQGSASVSASASNLTDLWKSKADFCEAFGGSPDDNSVCLDGGSILFTNSTNSIVPKGLCLEKIGNGSYLDMTAHRDGSNRVFLSSQVGRIWLATVPEEGSGGTLELDISNPFLDLTDLVHFDSEFGLLGLALHPNFTSNGRFFVSFNCDKVQSSACSGRCSCNSDIGCDPSTLPPDNGAQPCRYQSVISEFTVNSSSSVPSTATTGNPSEVRRIFTMGLPFTAHHGGQIIFGPKDGYLYFMMGDGGSQGDPYNFSQNKKSLLGKILRLDVDNIPSAAEIEDLDLWGNYSIPKDNPSAEDGSLQPEIWSLGVRNPWRCSFDIERPSYFYCADVGQELYEEVDLISKGGNFGWRVYEGPYLFHPTSSPGGNTSPNSINAIFPIMGYNHSSVNVNVGSASITGGFVYRSSVDPCLYGKYLYADLYAAAMWAGLENPENSGNYTNIPITFSCAKDSPLPCEVISGSPLPSLGYIFSFGQDNRRDVFLLASSGVYRVARPSRCGYVCSLEKNTSWNGSSAPAPQPSPAGKLESLQGKVVLMIFLVVFLVLTSSFGM